MIEGPRTDTYHNRELPERVWTTCAGCPAFRVFDFHYFYCRRLGDQTKPDKWNAGWQRVRATYNDVYPAPCGLQTVIDP